MSKGTEAVRHFITGMLDFENFTEFVVYNTTFFLLSVFIGNAVDNILQKIFKYIEKAGIVNKKSNLWLIIQIAIQLIVTSMTSYMVRLFVVGTMLSFSSDNNIYDARAVSIIYAFITFYPQDHLKENLKKLNKLLDR